MSLRFGRFHGFLLLSGVLIAAVVVTAGVVAGVFFKHYVLMREEALTAEFVQRQARQHLTAQDFGQDASGAPARQKNFETFMDELPGVFRLKVFDRAGHIVWSNEPRLIGMTYPDDIVLQNALRGRVTTVLGKPAGLEHVFERKHRYIAEAYVPISLAGPAGAVGVVETYRDMTRTMVEIRQSQDLIWAVAGAMGLILYGALGLLAWTSSAGERRAISHLEEQNRELSLLQGFARSVLRPLEREQVAASIVENAAGELGLSRTGLYQVGPDQDLSLLAPWPADSPPPAPSAGLVGEALAARVPVLRIGTVAVALFTPKGSPHLFVGEWPPSAPDPGRAASRVLEIMFQEASIALGNAELFTEIREAHERLAAVMAGTIDRMVILDRQMRVVWTNPAAAELSGGNAVGLACFELMGGAPEMCAGCPAARAFQSGAVERGVREITRPGGGTQYLDLIAAPLRDGSGQVYEVLEVARDVTELVEMEARLKQINQSLVDAQARLVEQERLVVVGQLVVGLHHAILNPLSGILGILQVVKAEMAGRPEQSKAIQEAEAQIRKIERLVRALPDLRRADGTPYVGQLTMLDLEGLGEDRASGR
jgi:PAS domain S-box-containing protein